MKILKIKTLLFALLLVSTASTFATDTLKSDRSSIKIQYLSQTHLNISSKGINRLHFEKERLKKIVGDSSQYSAILSENGSDLFLTSKLPAGESINLNLLLGSGQVMDLKLFVKQLEAPAIININANAFNSKELQNRQEIREMINKMAGRLKGKYFVEASMRAITIPSKPDLILDQYVSYRYGNLAGAGFNYRLNSKNLITLLTPEELTGIFKEILAISVVPDDKKPGEQGRVFIVFKYGEGIDV